LGIDRRAAGGAGWRVMSSAIVLHLPPGPGNQRNSEGSFVTLADGRVVLAYTRYRGESWADHAAAGIVARESADGGRTWAAAERVWVEGEGACNVMSVSLLRLADGRIALLYLRKNSLTDCRPFVRFSSDETRTWSEPVPVALRPGYYVVNNDRLVQLASGRLLVLAALHGGNRPAATVKEAFDPHAEVVVLMSDDAGATWREGPQRLRVDLAVESGLQEPGVIERRDGSLYGWARTCTGAQWEFESRDGGETWSEPRPSAFGSPCSPLSLKNLGTRTAPRWLAVWNDPRATGAAVRQESTWAAESSWGRTPLVARESRDDGHTWGPVERVETDPDRGFCYTALHAVGGAWLMAYCCGGRGTSVLQEMAVRRGEGLGSG
jgi:sialidase-1